MKIFISVKNIDKMRVYAILKPAFKREWRSGSAGLERLFRAPAIPGRLAAGRERDFPAGQ